MFTDRIDETGEIASFAGERIVVCVPKIARLVRPGGSLNVAGVCVTVEDVADGTVTAIVSAETWQRTTFDCCGPGQRVNVEPALAVGDPLDGHRVHGHIDAVGKVAGIDGQEAARVLDAGLILTGIDEPCPDDQVLARRPDLAEHRRRPPCSPSACGNQNDVSGIRGTRCAAGRWPGSCRCHPNRVPCSRPC